MQQGEMVRSLQSPATWQRGLCVVPPLGNSRSCIFITALVLFLAAERQMFLATWKDIPNENEAQFQIKDCSLNAGAYKPFRRTQLSL